MNILVLSKLLNLVNTHETFEGQIEIEGNEIVEEKAEQGNIQEVQEKQTEKNIEEVQEKQIIDENIDEVQLRKRAKKHKVNTNEWKLNENRKKREQGLAYEGKKKTGTAWNYNIKKPMKTLSAPCSCSLGKKPCVLKCATVSDEIRQKIFNYYWTLTWPEKKMYIRDLAKLETVKRRRGTVERSRRDYSIKYYLKFRNEYIRVCKRMFLATLGMKETVILNWLKESLQIEENIANKSNNVGHVRKQKFKASRDHLIRFFNNLPKMESHYCRASTSKLYLEPLWHTKSDLYNLYKNDFCPENNVTPVSITSFFKTYEELNLCIYRPKKDLCDTCVAYQSKNLSEEMYLLHRQLKDEARAEKQKDKNSENSFVFTMDLQSVLLSPRSTVSAMYYKQKLVVHNFTLYDLKNQEGYCYLWNETEGATTANEFATIITYFIETKLTPNMQNNEDIILYSDGCTGQNRNAILSNAILNLSRMYNITIVQKFLQKGHTQMEVDAMHSTIERKLKNRKINVPADYIHVCQIARKVPKPYNVKYLTHTFFKNFQSVKVYPSIRPGRTVGDATVTDIKALKYTADGIIKYKLRHSEDWLTLNQRKKDLPLLKFDDIPNLYEERRKIKKEKFDHLQILKQTLAADYHQFYDNIPYE